MKSLHSSGFARGERSRRENSGGPGLGERLCILDGIGDQGTVKGWALRRNLRFALGFEVGTAVIGHHSRATNAKNDFCCKFSGQPKILWPPCVLTPLLRSGIG